MSNEVGIISAITIIPDVLQRYKSRKTKFSKILRLVDPYG